MTGVRKGVIAVCPGHLYGGIGGFQLSFHSWTSPFCPLYHHPLFGDI